MGWGGTTEVSFQIRRLLMLHLVLHCPQLRPRTVPENDGIGKADRTRGNHEDEEDRSDGDRGTGSEGRHGAHEHDETEQRKAESATHVLRRWRLRH